MTSPVVLETAEWSARVLSAAPMIAPSKQVVWPIAVPGEEDALARGAVYVEVRIAQGGTFLATCALGYASGSVATGLYRTPHPYEVCVAAGGYAYLADVRTPERCLHLGLRPVVSVVQAEDGTLVFAGFHHCAVRDGGDEVWETPRLSWEGITGLAVSGTVVTGMGWDLETDLDVPFAIDLTSRRVRGGVFQMKSS